MNTQDQDKKIEEQQDKKINEQEENKFEETKEYQEQQTPERLPVGELKWSQEEEEKRQLEQLAKDDDSSFTFAEKEVSATALKNRNLEDTLTPIDFKEYQLEVNSQPEKDKAKMTKAEEEPQTDEQEQTDRKKKWIKILWYPALLVVSLFAGLIIGHSVIADQPVSDVFNIDVWKHLYDLIYG
jgi:hypothetical protein